MLQRVSSGNRRSGSIALTAASTGSSSADQRTRNSKRHQTVCFAVWASFASGSRRGAGLDPLWVGLVSVCVFSAGCFGNDSCESGEFHCDGRVARNCIAETRRFYEEDCAEQDAYCAETSEEAICALSRERDERCTETTTGWCLEDGTAVRCNDGFPVSVWGRPCEQICVESGGEGFCTISPDPDPSCPVDDGWRYLCLENRTLACYRGYLQGSSDCGEERSCVDGRCESPE